MEGYDDEGWNPILQEHRRVGGNTEDEGEYQHKRSRGENASGMVGENPTDGENILVRNALLAKLPRPTYVGWHETRSEWYRNESAAGGFGLPPPNRGNKRSDGAASAAHSRQLALTP